jgi:signal transduction histidine kinase
MENKTEIALLIFLGCFAMLFLALVIIVFVVTYQRKMLEKETRIKLIEKEQQVQLFKATVEAEEKLKEKIANDLHDSVNPLLSLLKMNLSMHRRNVEKGKFNPENLKEDSTIIDQAIEGIRSSCRELIPSFLLQFGIVKSLEDYVRNLNKNEQLQAEFMHLDNGNGFSDADMPKQDQLGMYRVCMEVLNNLFKHAGYTRLGIQVETLPNKLLVEFTHNGKAIDDQEIEAITNSSKGQGLKSLKVRVLLLGAQLNYFKAEEGARILLSVPVKVVSAVPID